VKQIGSGLKNLDDSVTLCLLCVAYKTNHNEHYSTSTHFIKIMYKSYNEDILFVIFKYVSMILLYIVGCYDRIHSCTNSRYSRCLIAQ
jgi:hypothetical protein